MHKETSDAHHLGSSVNFVSSTKAWRDERQTPSWIQEETSINRRLKQHTSERTRHLPIQWEYNLWGIAHTQQSIPKCVDSIPQQLDLLCLTCLNPRYARQADILSTRECDQKYIYPSWAAGMPNRRRIKRQAMYAVLETLHNQHYNPPLHWQLPNKDS